MSNVIDILQNPELKKSFYDVCKVFSDSDLCPKNLKGKPNECYIVALKGHQLGLDPFSSFESIASINGKAMIYGDAIIGLGSKHSNFKSYSAKYEGEGANLKCIITIKKNEGEDFIYSFSTEEAKIEGCLNKDIWKKNLKDMLWRRASRKAFKICFPEMFCGVQVSEANNLKEADILETETKPQSTEEMFDNYKSETPQETEKVNPEIVENKSAEKNLTKKDVSDDNNFELNF